MQSVNLAGLDSLADLGTRSGVDMRPTLLRVLTDLYVQKLAHTPDEERHYTELALRLLDSVDVTTRAVVATRLARHLTPPLKVIQRLARDLPAIAEPIRSHPALTARLPAEAPPAPAAQPVIDAAASEPPARDIREDYALLPAADLSAPIATDVAVELNELFFAASAEERRLILLNLDVVAPFTTGRIALSRDLAILQRLERAALERHRDEFVQQLATALQIPRAQAQRIAADQLGEPVVTAAKALQMPRDVLYRVLLFVNTAVGHSVERVHSLATLYDEMSTPAAEHMVAIWQALQTARKPERKPVRHQPLFYNDERVRARSASATVRRAPAPQRATVRRDVS